LETDGDNEVETFPPPQPERERGVTTATNNTNFASHSL
jgi:hypothetical protein